MTFWDNPQMVINHLRHSCVTSDDTGMCEMVIVQDEGNFFQVKARKRIGMFHSDEGSDFQTDYSQSFDIAVSPGVMGRTPKTNRNSNPKSKQEFQCKTIHWNENLEGITDDQKMELFEEKNIHVNSTKNIHVNSTKNASVLSQRLADLLNQPNNPFVQYAKFDGEGVEDTCPTKCIEVFLSFLPTEEERLQPMNITFVDSATVQDVIGLTLYKYVLKGRKPRYQNDVKSYSLHIAEEDGEVDMDFQALDEKEPMSRFGFLYLALVEKHKQTKQPVVSKNSVEVKILIPQNGSSVIKVDRTDVKMKTILAKLIKKRGLKRSINDFHLEKQGEEGQHVDLEMSLDATGTLVFNLVGMGEKDKELHSKTSTAQAEIMSLQYKSYQVLLIHRLTSTDVSLGIHGQKIEIDPVAQPKSQKFWTKIKPMSLDVENIAECEITDKKPLRSVFRIYYKKTDDFKHYEFETEPQRADEIVRKIHNILKSRFTTVREEFLSTRGTKKKFK